MSIFTGAPGYAAVVADVGTLEDPGREGEAPSELQGGGIPHVDVRRGPVECEATPRATCRPGGRTKQGPLERVADEPREVGARREEAYALSYIGGCGGLYGNDSPESEHCQNALSIFRELEDRRGIALSSQGLAWAALHGGDYAQAKQFFQDSLAGFKEMDDQEGIITSMGGLGYTAWILGEYQHAKQLHREMLNISRQAGDKGGVARSIGDLGIDACGLKEYEESMLLFQESLAICREIGHLRGIADELGDLGEVSNLMGDFEMAARHARESLEIFTALYKPYATWALRVLGNAACGMGNLPKARRYLHQALERATLDGRMGHALLALTGIAAVLKAQGEKEKALELLVLVYHHPVSWQLAKDQALLLLKGLEAELPPEVVSLANERARSRDLNSTITDLLAELRESA